MKNIKAIFFDAGGTLFRPYRSVGEIYADTARRFGLEVTGEQVEMHFREAWLRKSSLSSIESTNDERVWWYELVDEVFSHYGDFKDFDAFFNELHDLFACPELWHLFPEVITVLETLRKNGYILGVVSNWDSRLVRLCDRLCISKNFNFILASRIVGSSKPHRGIFEEALKRAKVQADEAVHVGDSIKDDYEAPIAVGIQALLIDREGHHGNSVKKISSLNDIFQYLDSKKAS